VGSTPTSRTNLPIVSDFKFDVAFSFLSQDEPLARKLNDLLAARVKTYIYSDAEHQTMLAGQDGEEYFNRVFGHESRTVVVLYRKGYGEKGFTGAEQTAIRNRAFNTDMNYSFVTLIPLDKPLTPPSWLPKNRIWLSLDTFTAEKAALVIESRIWEQGGESKEETAIEAAARVKREMIQESERRNFVAAGTGEAKRGIAVIAKEFERIVENSDGMFRLGSMKYSADGPATQIEAVYSNSLSVTVTWHPAFGDSDHRNVLKVAEWRGAPLALTVPLPEPEFAPLREEKFFLDALTDLTPGWRSQRHPRGRFYTHEQLADYAVKRLLARIQSNP
jgi:hypothetical protein